jgi:hypothetical protein
MEDGSAGATRNHWTLARYTGFPYMQDDDFSWDDDKAAQNCRDHGVTFEMARDAFGDSFAIE